MTAISTQIDNIIVLLDALDVDMLTKSESASLIIRRAMADFTRLKQMSALKNRLITLREMESKNTLSQKLLVERNAVTDRLDAIETRIAFRMREGQLV